MLPHGGIMHSVPGEHPRHNPGPGGLLTAGGHMPLPFFCESATPWPTQGVYFLNGGKPPFFLSRREFTNLLRIP